MNIGRYRIIDEIGRGAMGVVFKAHDPNLDIILALKVLRKERLTNEPFVRRFMAEARALGRLDHPEIVRVYNVDQDGDEVYIAMEFIQGEPISALMKKQLFTPDAIAEFGSRMAEALDYAHKKGIIHRDVKPSNILCTQEGRLKITDFGIARIEDPSKAEETQAGEILGTPAYMSPEQVLGLPVDGRSDLFSLGIILYEMATGSRPFQGQGMNAIFNAITNDDPHSIHTISQTIPRQLSDVIMKCLRKSPEARHADGRELATALRSSITASAPVAAVATVQKEKSGKHTAVLAVAGVLVAVAITVFLLMGRTSPPPAAPAVAGTPSPTPPSAVAQKSARLKAESTPAGATLYVDGVQAGFTPNTVSLVPGKHELIISLPNYDKWEAQVEFEKGTETPVSVTLSPSGK
ncbi:MAG TPA: serine/threonine protein kinase [Desulfuromonadales bacterium]|nr:serine/threonine protein kinase [Desulfuromonadales bacterium]